MTRPPLLHRSILLTAISLLTLSAASASSADLPPEPAPTAALPIDTRTNASDPNDVMLSFVHPGRVTKILVKVGDRVQQGQLLAQQDDSEEQAEFDYAQAQANDNTRVAAQEKIRDQKAKALERKAKAGDSVTISELEEAQVDSDVAIAQTALAKFEHEQDGLKFAQAKAVLDKTKLYSPITGVIQQVLIHEGESVDTQNMRVMRVVNVNPLWIDAPVPFAQAAKIKINDFVRVTFSDQKTGEGSVLSISPVADFASGTRYVRVAVKNDSERAAGERVQVSFDPNGKVADNQTQNP